MALHNLQQLSDAHEELQKRVEKLEAFVRASGSGSSSTRKGTDLDEAIRKAREDN